MLVAFGGRAVGAVPTSDRYMQIPESVTSVVDAVRGALRARAAKPASSPDR
jgi:hypothetical protein